MTLSSNSSKIGSASVVEIVARAMEPDDILAFGDPGCSVEPERGSCPRVAFTCALGSRPHLNSEKLVSVPRVPRIEVRLVVPECDHITLQAVRPQLVGITRHRDKNFSRHLFPSPRLLGSQKTVVRARFGAVASSPRLASFLCCQIGLNSTNSHCM
jgi:hypothetical protein